MPTSVFLRGLILGAVALSAGCTGGATSSPQIDPTQDRLIKIGTAYREYNDRQAKPPAKEDDLKSILKDDSVWISARDEQPFVVIWNVDLRQPPTWAGDKTPVLAYERVGKNGKRLVRTTIGAVIDMSAAEFAACAFPPGHSPESAP